jgi:hypothetical protein
MRTNAMVVDDLALAAALEELGRRPRPGTSSGGWPTRARQGPPSSLAALPAGTASRAVFRGPVERRLGDPRRRSGCAEAVTELAQLVVVQLLLLVGDVLALAGLAQAVALDGLGQDHRGPALCSVAALVGGVDLLGSWPPRRSARALVAQVATSFSSSGYGRRSARGCRRRPATLYFWYSPSTTSSMRLRAAPRRRGRAAGPSRCPR